MTSLSRAAEPRHMVGLLLLAGLIVRLCLIGQYYIGPDEAWHIDIAGQPGFGDVIAYNFAGNVHPPLYYLLLHAVMQVSDSRYALRILSIAPWMAWVCLCYRIGQYLDGSRYGLIWAALAVIGNGPLEYALAIREYMWMLLFITGQFYYFLRLCRQYSRRDMAGYLICGLFAIASEYSAVIAIFLMGCILAAQAFRAQLRPWRTWLEVATVHLLLALFFAALYSQHILKRPDYIQWYNSYYYTSAMTAFLLFVQSTVEFVLIPGPMLGQMVVVAMFITIQPFYRRFPAAAAFMGAGCFLMLALNAFHAYPPPFAMRFITWMVPALMVWLSFAIDSLLMRIPGRMRAVCAAAAVVAVAWNAASAFSIPEASMATYKEFEEQAAAIGASDLVYMDIQTMMQLKYHDDWKAVAHHAHEDEALWQKREVFYPNWMKLDSIDSRTGVQTGGIGLSRQSLIYFTQIVDERRKSTPHAWIVHLGLPTNLGKECNRQLEQAMVWRLQESYMARFTPREFLHFISDCSSK